MRFYPGFLMASLCLFGACASAHAQVATEIGKAIAAGVFHVADEHSCRAGHNPYAKGTTERIRGMSEISLKNYIRLSGGGVAVDVHPAFSTKKVTLSWSRDGQAGEVGAVDDPVARSLATAADGFDARVRNEQFLIAGDKFSTMGLWRVVAADDPTKVIGWYRARFWRHNTLGGQTWDLMNLELTTGATEPAKVVQYCNEPGDVEKYLAERQAKAAERASKKAEQKASERH